MDITLFLAQIWGPIILAVGIGSFMSRDFYLKIYRDLQKETLGVLTFGMVAMAGGITQVAFHNVWDTLPQILISLLGWALLIKGTLFIIAPRLVDRGGDWAADSRLLPAIGGFTLLVGAYLSWLAYLA